MNVSNISLICQRIGLCICCQQSCAGNFIARGKMIRRPFRLCIIRRSGGVFRTQTEILQFFLCADFL